MGDCRRLSDRLNANRWNTKHQSCNWNPMSPTQKIPVIGIGPDGAAGLSVRSRELLGAAEMVFGSDAALRLLPELSAERVADRLRPAGRGREAPRRTSARSASPSSPSGDPLFYGTARYLCEKVGAEQFEVVPHVSSMQLAFARIKETWEEAYLTDLSARPLDDVIDKIRTAETVGLFTSDDQQPGPRRPRTARPRHRLLHRLGLREPRRQGRADHEGRTDRHPRHEVRPAEHPDPEAQAEPPGRAASGREAPPLRQPGRRLRADAAQERPHHAGRGPRDRAGAARSALRRRLLGRRRRLGLASRSRPRRSSAPARATRSNRTRPTIT